MRLNYGGESRGRLLAVPPYLSVVLDRFPKYSVYALLREEVHKELSMSLPKSDMGLAGFGLSTMGSWLSWESGVVGDWHAAYFEAVW